MAWFVHRRCSAVGQLPAPASFPTLTPHSPLPHIPPTTHAGVSLKTQELFLIVFCCRYLDLFFRFISLYNSVMKILYIAATAAIVHMIRCKVGRKEGDGLPAWRLYMHACIWGGGKGSSHV